MYMVSLCKCVFVRVYKSDAHGAHANLCMVRVYNVYGVCVFMYAFVCLCVCGGGVRLGVCVRLCVFLRACVCVCARACVYVCVVVVVWVCHMWLWLCVGMSGAYGADVYGVHESIRAEPYCAHARCYVYWQYCQHDTGMCTYIYIYRYVYIYIYTSHIYVNIYIYIYIGPGMGTGAGTNIATRKLDVDTRILIDTHLWRYAKWPF